MEQSFGKLLTQNCSYMEGTGTNPFIMGTAKFVNITHPQLIHKCPYKGDFDLFNYTMSGGLPPESQIFPQGYYKLTTIGYRNNVAVFTVTINAEITSTLKENFG